MVDQIKPRTVRLLPHFGVVKLLASCKAALLVVLLACVATTAIATELPEFDKRISIAAREQPINAFFAELFGEIGIPVSVDPSVRGSVNGDFRGTAQDIYRNVEKAFQLTMYYDRSTVFIYSANQVSRNIIPMSENVGRRVLYNAKKMGIGNARNKVEWTDMGLVVIGTDRYRRQIESYATAIQKRQKKPVAAVKPVAEPKAKSAPNEIIKIFKLNYAWADDTTVVSGGQELMIRGVASLLRSVVEGDSSGAANGARSNVARTEPGLRGQGLQSIGQNQIANNQGGNPSAVSSNGSRIVADPINNAVIIRDRADRMANYQELISSLDIEPTMLEIEATIIDMDTDRLRSLGIDWRYQSDEANIIFGNSSTTNGDLGAGVQGLAEGLAGFTQNVLNNKAKFLTHIRALESQGAARIVSKPHVMTLANVEALLDTTSTFFVRVAGREEVDLFNVSVGTTMRVTPHVFERGNGSQIKMKINIVDGSQSQQKVDDIPVIEESTINTQAIINAGQSLLIGGLVREFKSSDVSKVPVLGDIPGVGNLFRSNKKTNSRLERMFLITPRLATQQVPTGKRYSVPILSGNEEQIIESAPSRIDSTLTGLAKRDLEFPVKRPLPRGSANAELSSSGASSEALNSKRGNNALSNEGYEAIKPSTDQDSLNPEFLEQPPENPSPIRAPVYVEPAPTIVSAPSVPESEEPWQSISIAPTKTPTVSRTIDSNATVNSQLDNAESEQNLVRGNQTSAGQPAIGSEFDWVAVPQTSKQNLGVQSQSMDNGSSSNQGGWTEIGQ